ncbi:lysozyme inhibitor LprI family protein [Phenylobacterium sp.]|uniref:lysozyme inhibitor LprI family protein n=1 Tax=Phenylobacterium sp. TaxID=1871053 RepID=UPI0025D36C5A|nr:lysozyme inhibitor LprI family protein [Phenylobacterium sp.]
MPSDDLRGEPTTGALPGFQTYADDTPRGDEPRSFSPREPRTWAGTSAPLVVAPGRAEDALKLETPPARRRTWPIAATAGAVLAAFAGGFLIARTDPPPPAAQAEAAAPPMNVEVAAVKPAAIPSVAAVGKLEVLPPESAPPRRAGEPRRAPSPPVEAPTLALPAPEAPARGMARAVTGQDATALATPGPARRSFACRDAPTRARQMVCADMGLAALDRRMKQAYAAALSAGAHPDALAADQDDWLDVREEAARRSRWAVASVYRQRIGELWELADRGPR